MGDKLVRYEKNPVIQGSHVSPDHSQAADPYLLVANGRLYVFFEAVRERNSPPNGCCGEIWMAESTDGFTWSGFRRVSSKSIHMSHPYAFVHQDQIHVLYNNNSSGGIFHRSSALSSFPDWSREAEIFRGSDHGWHHLVEFFTIEQAGSGILSELRETVRRKISGFGVGGRRNGQRTGTRGVRRWHRAHCSTSGMTGG